MFLQCKLIYSREKSRLFFCAHFPDVAKRYPIPFKRQLVFQTVRPCLRSFSGIHEGAYLPKEKSGLTPLFALPKARSLSEGTSQNHPPDAFWQRAICCRS